MKITFVLPGTGQNPSGGFRVVYEYANRLSQRGHEVCIVHPAYIGAARRLNPVLACRKSLTRYVTRLLTGRWRPRAWFAIDPKVRLVWVPFLHSAFIQDADAIVATLWLTAEQIAQLAPRKGRKYYLIQGLETWGGGEERVMATWKAPLRKIVIARWLEDIGRDLGERCDYLPNGLDFSKFGCDVAIEARRGTHVGMLWHSLTTKGSADGIAALTLVKQSVPELTVELFGVKPRPEQLPEWMQYHQNPGQEELRRLYNRCGIFVSPSWAEGWGLPASEAMMCGAAVVATDIGGHREFARHEQTALISPARDPQALATNVLRLIQDEALRQTLAENGRLAIQQFTWERAVNRLEAVLSEPCA